MLFVNEEERDDDVTLRSGRGLCRSLDWVLEVNEEERDDDGTLRSGRGLCRSLDWVLEVNEEEMMMGLYEVVGDSVGHCTGCWRLMKRR